jgi:DNA-binding FadR family transcriptional regulator
MDQHIEAGARVNIDLVARQLNVSPTPVREALARLEMDGLAMQSGPATPVALRRRCSTISIARGSVRREHA